MQNYILLIELISRIHTHTHTQCAMYIQIFAENVMIFIIITNHIRDIL